MPMNVNLSPQLEELVRQKVASGLYTSASEVVREALRLMDEELAPALRSFPVGRYLIFYVALTNGIDIVRVLHGSRDIATLFQDDDG